VFKRISEMGNFDRVGERQGYVVGGFGGRSPRPQAHDCARHERMVSVTNLRPFIPILVKPCCKARLVRARS
jgi:hypothetical protein